MTSFYRKHRDWSAAGKAAYRNSIAVSLLSARHEVNPHKIRVTGHSLGGHSSIWLAAYDERVRCAVPSCAASAFRENPRALQWSRDHWYTYFPNCASRCSPASRSNAISTR